MLFLNDNAFSGLIPDTVGSTPVRYLTLANNKFQGRIPTAIGRAKNLEEIVLSGNQISSPLPDDIASIKNLTLLDLSNNQLASQVPEALCQIKLCRSIFNVSNNSSANPWVLLVRTCSPKRFWMSLSIASKVPMTKKMLWSLLNVMIWPVEAPESNFLVVVLCAYLRIISFS